MRKNTLIFTSNYSRIIKVGRGLTLFVSIVLFFASCKKENSDIGTNLRDDNGVINVNYADVFDVKAYTILEDSLKTDSLSFTILGAINDPIFGTKSASVYAELTIPEVGYDFTGATLDSVVLTLLIQQSQFVSSDDSSVHLKYGDFASNQSFKVYQIDESPSAEKRFFSNATLPLNAEIGSYNGQINFTDSSDFYADGDTFRYPPTIHVKLDDAFGQTLISQPLATYESVESFQNFIKGIALIPETSGLAIGQGGIWGMDLVDRKSAITIYYNGGETKTIDFNGFGSQFQNYSVIDKTVAISEQLGNPKVHYDEVYVQSMAGSKAKIEINGIYDLVADGPILVNEARIEFPLKQGTYEDNRYPAPFRMLMFQPDEETGLNFPITDQIPFSSNPGTYYYGGEYDDESKSYTFFFQRHLQEMLDEYLADGVDSNNGFFLTIPSDFPITPSRAVINTKKGEGIKIFIRYTKLY